ncbi:hypothetical protein LOK49_LG12G02031 [Camellia lanceoleosa]|uniref:Uncharacterized protein n=1 Tax=Camellia lanceoleosa TaxID=1840588 RepID=A0ACC0FRM3_9ERIC|nr:hypothetical protein LOK49_LG12G02031 [Camellia lanceoleosa]
MERERNGGVVLLLLLQRAVVRFWSASVYGCSSLCRTQSLLKHKLGTWCIAWRMLLNLPQNQEEMVWLIDFHGFNLSNISVKSTRETARVLQEHYPERLGVTILYNPPKFFEPFWTDVELVWVPRQMNKAAEKVSTHVKASFWSSKVLNAEIKAVNEILDNDKGKLVAYDVDE